MQSCILQSWPHRCIFVHSTGLVSGNAWCEMINYLMCTECYEMGFPVLHDMRGADFSTTAADMLKPGRVAVEPIGPGHPRKVAMVGSGPLAFALMGVVARLRENDHHKPKAFTHMGEATAWIDHPEFGGMLPAEVDRTMTMHLNASRAQVIMVKSGSPRTAPVPGTAAQDAPRP